MVDDMEIKEGMKFKVKEIKNPLIKTEIGNIVEVVRVSKISTEFRDIKTFDWFIVGNENIEKYLEVIGK